MAVRPLRARIDQFLISLGVPVVDSRLSAAHGDALITRQKGWRRMTVLVAVDSESGNTLEMALEIRDALRSAGADVHVHRINGRVPLEPVLAPCLAFIGTYTWGFGEPPEDTARFMRKHPLDDCPVACYGSGETQWGEEHFCGAVDRLRRHYGSPWPGFRQEQMPNSRRRAELREWALEIMGQASGRPVVSRELVGNG